MPELTPFHELVERQKELVDRPDALWELAAAVADFDERPEEVAGIVVAEAQLSVRALADAYVPVDSTVRYNNLQVGHRRGKNGNSVLAWEALDLPEEYHVAGGRTRLFLATATSVWLAEPTGRFVTSRLLQQAVRGNILLRNDGGFGPYAESSLPSLNTWGILSLTRVAQINAALRNDVVPES